MFLHHLKNTEEHLRKHVLLMDRFIFLFIFSLVNVIMLYSQDQFLKVSVLSRPQTMRQWDFIQDGFSFIFKAIILFFIMFLYSKLYKTLIS